MSVGEFCIKNGWDWELSSLYFICVLLLAFTVKSSKAFFLMSSNWLENRRESYINTIPISCRNKIK